LVTNRVGNSIDREMVVVTARESDARKNKPQVADLILRTRALDFKPQSLKVFEEQISLYRHVLLLDPGNAKATAGLARALSLSAFNGFVEDPVASKRQVAEACDLAVKAKDLDPSVAEVYSTLGLCAFEHGDMEGARHADERALSLEPKNPKWYSNVAIGYIWAGRPAKAIEVLSEGIRLDPRKLPGEVLGSMGLAQFYLGNDLAAIEWLLRAVDAAPDLVQPQVLLAMTYARRGDLVRARAAVEATLRMDPKFKLSQVRPGPKFPAGIRELFETIALPAGRAAGLPE
jgi:tetratricopeptide (TPR) repeat protein